VFSCQKKKIEPAMQTAEKSPHIRILGEIPNPYKLSHAQTALENLKSTHSRMTMPTTIRTTSKYVVFKPTTITQADSLLLKTDLELFPYPLHLEIEGNLEEYREPSLAEEQPDWFYTVVRADFQFPADVPYQVLENLYIPYDDENIANAQREILPQFMEWLDEFEKNAEIAAGVPTEEAQRRGRWTPSGRIQVFDNTVINPLNPNLIINRAIPCHGAKVRIRNGVLFFHTLTDMNGNFNFGRSVRNKVNYGIVWEREDYIIKDMNGFGRWTPVRPLVNFTRAAFLNGPKQNTDWNTTISDRKHSYFATIHRAACDYYYHTPFGLQTPPKNTWLNKGKIHIAAYLREGSNHSGYFNAIVGLAFGGTGLGIAIFDADRMKIDVYATTIHELGHATHWELRGRSDFYFANHTHCELRESWADAVAWAITSNTYKSIINNNNFDFGSNQSYTKNFSGHSSEYTPIIIDLIDNNNQYLTNSLEFPNDSVQGFSIKDCENALRGNVNNFGDFYQRLVNTPTAQNQLAAFDTLFEFYYSLTFNCSSGSNAPNTRKEGGVR
jgi:hypothetical protein